ncbi:MAG: hemerythrin domain-containing protein [Deltaproteobacteria bacterium]|nr:hemerythrin domain-containing protein [Deltaproteobacteria bacterium]
MQLLLATADAVVGLWPAMSRPTEQTPRWIRDITSIFAVLIERQADHFALEEHALLVELTERAHPDPNPTLERFRAKHSTLHAATREARQMLRELGPRDPISAKTQMLALLARLRRHEHEEPLLLKRLLDAPEHFPAFADGAMTSSIRHRSEAP